ncbi:MAG TPA: GTPase HflX [Acidimicrobiia bacterium]|nr:GTPase HflX [Acidimicrobiia bacterium]
MTSEHQSRARKRLTATVTDLEVAVQRAFLIGVLLPGMSAQEEERSIDELALLTDTAGADPVDQEIVKRDRIDPASFIGSGKAEELATLTTALDIDVVIFDQALSPAQQRNLQKIFHCDVVDREGLILDIFAQHATSKVGAIQVELALLRYNLPRLRGRTTALAQQRAGVGTTMRGPGETKLETDRRRVLARISKLERQLKETAGHRETQRKQRKRTQIPQVAIVGYTNAGKSTLLNALTDADTLVQDQLFATLDSTVRRLELPDGRPIVIADTVGFVRRLPHHLVEAFRSTLSETSEADLLVHLVDGTDEDPAGQIDAVTEVLKEIGAASVPQLLVINKTDALDESAIKRLHNLWPEAVLISAREGLGLDSLLEAIAEELARGLVTLSLTVPYERGDVVAAAHRLGEVIEEKHDEDGTILDVRLPERATGQFAEFVRP